MLKTMRKGWKKLIKTISLQHGKHNDRSNGLCAMELAAYIADEPHSDHPECVCPIIGEFMRLWNDALPTDTERDRLLKPLIPLTISTKANKEIEERRSFMCIDWTVRTFTPTWLAACGDRYSVHVAALTSVPEIVDWNGLIATTPILVNAQKQVAAAWAAARAAAWAAACDAACSAASAAASDAARAAACNAACDVAWDAALDVARDALKPTTITLQESAADLVKRMCEVRSEEHTS